jgi:hypothetical protein
MLDSMLKQAPPVLMQHCKCDISSNMQWSYMLAFNIDKAFLPKLIGYMQLINNALHISLSMDSDDNFHILPLQTIQGKHMQPTGVRQQESDKEGSSGSGCASCIITEIRNKAYHSSL